MKFLKFIPAKKEVTFISENPKTAKSQLPEWYKKMPTYTDGQKTLEFPIDWDTHNHTMKRCMPFLDAMTAGYTLSLDEDVFVKQTEQGPLFRWKSKETMVTLHSLNQFEGLVIPDNFHYMVAKWHNDWQIVSPPGYSLLFVHPINRFDLPFQTLTGIVDCDNYEIPVQFPFFLRNGFEGIIEAGTPVVQLIPIKRENWKTKKEPYNEQDVKTKFRRFQRTFADSYKKNFWVRKEYY
jgi:hypothetical protein